MSGGSHEYLCFQVEEEYVGSMHDKEMDALIDDVSKVLRGLEWYDSGDIGIDEYRECIRAFKKKWFMDSREDRMKAMVEEECGKLKEELLNCIGC